jgi:hypothetical protein
MALVGRFEKITSVESTTEFDEILVTIPDNLDPDHPEYEYRGQQKTFTQPKLIHTVEWVMENAYIVIKAIAVHLEDIDRLENEIDNNFSKSFRVNIMYNVYESNEQRLLNFHNPTERFQNSEVFYINLSEIQEKSILIWGYEKLKTLPGFENLEDN